MARPWVQFPEVGGGGDTGRRVICIQRLHILCGEKKAGMIGEMAESRKMQNSSLLQVWISNETHYSSLSSTRVWVNNDRSRLSLLGIPRNFC